MGNLINNIFGHPWDIATWVGAIILVSVIGGLITGGIAIVTGYFRDRARDEMDATIKMEMLERGMSADEIIKVLAATSSHDNHDWGCEHPRHSHSQRRAMRRAMREMSPEQRQA